MAYLDNVVDISELGRRKFVVLYGRSFTGKTELGSSWPKPMLYAQLGDDGSNTIAKKKGIKALHMENPDTVRALLKELIAKKGGGYKTVFVDTFSMLTNVWTDVNVIQKKKKMTQQAWGELKTETEELIRLAHELSKYVWVLVSCHEATDVIEGMEDEIVPDVRPSITKGARTYLEGMANFAFHTTKLQKEVPDAEGVDQTVVKYGIHIGPNPYYWTKLQVDRAVSVPKVLINPSFKKLVEKGLIEE